MTHCCGGLESQRRSQSATERRTRQEFDEKKHLLAKTFLEELDDTLTNGQLAKLTKDTGGIKLNWTKKLITTAGRANWRKETVKAPTDNDMDSQPKHHASIDLAEKVIDNNQRLLNVIAHEFCHLANFMISGVTNRPHGKEFKAWASKCSEAFADRGIEVTTKHSYDINFKYIWKCVSCGIEYKRHSKSINPQRHRCGGCKDHLEQIKPPPRARNGLTEYHLFVQEQMKKIRLEYPGMLQRETMRMIADRWALLSQNKEVPGTAKGERGTVDSISISLDALEL
ncbi:hypothetical protein jhhlp_002617 [Lomentospora prolificans]|uniref:SprT-like domain-containing protein n=1 Tax=Lomentospora prolificans TaxID=41688 RepID=A0A2N3NEH7_9PEZI|nr:hypothetical protein jhhlp_002617 [Lomentospora prolificans]